MNQVESLQQQQYDIGYPIFKQLFDLTDLKLKEKLKSICEKDIPDLLYTSTSHVRRTIENEKPTEIVISYYDSVVISPWGIYLQREHSNRSSLVKFNQHFVL